MTRYKSLNQMMPRRMSKIRKELAIGEVRQSKATHVLSSGMGGTFDVRILREYAGHNCSRCDVQIDMPRNSDWDGIVYEGIDMSHLRPLIART